MCSIIDGVKYNTETATRIAYYDNEYSLSDFQYLQEGLYRKRTGEFFLAGKGGAMTKYARKSGNASSGGSKIIPLTHKEAERWCEERLSVDEYEAVFGEVSE